MQMSCECEDKWSHLRWNSNIAHKTGQSRTNLVETKWKIPREYFTEP